ncbi:cytochrome P450 [Nocardioides sp. dk4132]|uniref:cytochrome P450 n=1 Tax=unclassified Nocardioides TaxID=2615069 RepID=UPI001297417C|nr:MULTISPECIES: cytochrome P450 [unclassified Nocardioides]MQW77602.1 cytochrome P450 [Nocardioides sp. dk4132]QGA06128.1 cytochrome P450 [Nocardioides sp. dk884]
MTTDELEAPEDISKKALLFSMNRHDAGYRIDFEANAAAMQSRCPIAWNDTHGGYWFAAGHQELFDLARRADVLSSDDDPFEVRAGYQGISIPPPPKAYRQGSAAPSFLAMDPPRQRHWRQALNAYLSPAAVARWKPVLDEIVRASVDEFIEKGEVDFVDELANVVPAIMTMGLLGWPLAEYEPFVEPTHAQVYLSPDDLDGRARLQESVAEMRDATLRLYAGVKETRNPGLVEAMLDAELAGGPPEDAEVLGNIALLIGGGFDTTTALTAHSLDWLSGHPEERQRLIDEWDTLIDSATEEFLRFYTPASGDGRTIAQDVEIDGVRFEEGERLWLSWAMANRDPKVFENPNEIILDRTGNRHASFGLGIHRCIGSNVARSMFKAMLKEVLDRLPDFTVDPASAVYYDTTGVINGMKHLKATFTPGERRGPNLAETMAAMQKVIDEQRIAEPVTRNARIAEVT